MRGGSKQECGLGWLLPGLEIDNVDSVGTLTPDGCHPVSRLQSICLSNGVYGELKQKLKRCRPVILTRANGHENLATVGQDDQNGSAASRR